MASEEASRNAESNSATPSSIPHSVHGFRGSIAECGIELGVAVDQTHAFAATTGDRLQKNRIAHALREGLRFGRFFDGVVHPGDRWDIDIAGKLAAGGLGTERFHGAGGRPDEREAGVNAGARQRGVFSYD